MLYYILSLPQPLRYADSMQLTDVTCVKAYYGFDDTLSRRFTDDSQTCRLFNIQHEQYLILVTFYI